MILVNDYNKLFDYGDFIQFKNKVGGEIAQKIIIR